MYGDTILVDTIREAVRLMVSYTVDDLRENVKLARAYFAVMAQMFYTQGQFFINPSGCCQTESVPLVCSLLGKLNVFLVATETDLEVLKSASRALERFASFMVRSTNPDLPDNDERRTKCMELLQAMKAFNSELFCTSLIESVLTNIINAGEKRDVVDIFAPLLPLMILDEQGYSEVVQRKLRTPTLSNSKRNELNAAFTSLTEGLQKRLEPDVVHKFDSNLNNFRNLAHAVLV